MSIFVSSFSFANTPYATNWWTLGSGGAGQTFLTDFPAAFYNPSRLEAKQEDALSYHAIFPAISASYASTKLVEISGINRKVEYIVNHIGKPISAEIGAYASVQGNRWALSIFRNDQVFGLLSNDIYLANGAEALSLSGRETTGINLAFSKAWNKSIYAGLTSKFLYSRHENFFSSLTDFTRLEKYKNFIEKKSGSGFLLDGALTYENENGFISTLLLRQIGDAALRKSTLSGDKIEVFKQSTDIAIGYELKFEDQTKINLCLDYDDLLSRIETNNLKKIHIGAIFVKSNWKALGGINQGYPTYGLFLVINSFEFGIGQYTVETGSKIGLHPDPRMYMTLGGHF